MKNSQKKKKETYRRRRDSRGKHRPLEWGRRRASPRRPWALGECRGEAAVSWRCVTLWAVRVCCLRCRRSALCWEGGGGLTGGGVQYAYRHQRMRPLNKKNYLKAPADTATSQHQQLSSPLATWPRHSPHTHSHTRRNAKRAAPRDSRLKSERARETSPILPLHTILQSPILYVYGWCMAYKGRVGGWDYIAQWSCNSIAPG